MVPSPRIAESATFALNSVEKLRRLAMLWNPFNQAGFHLIALSDFLGSTSEGKAVQRSLLSKNYASASEGINTASLSKDTGGNGLAGRSTSRVEGSGTAGAKSSSDYSKTRDLEKIQILFNRNKSGLFTMYNRELRKDASLQGKVVLSITIAPSVEVTNIRIVSSELGNPRLERKLMQRVKLINFGAEDVPPYTFTYPIDFYPA